MIVQANSYRIPLKDNSVHAIVTSPPYWGLRDYGLEPTVFGGKINCRHVWGQLQEKHDVREGTTTGKTRTTDRFYGDESRRFNGNHEKHISGQFCQLCDAWLGSYGLEPTIALFVQHSVEIARECYRVLRPDGVMFWNLGDSYATSKNGRSAAATKAAGKDNRTFRDKPFSIDELPAKNLCGIPWRVALALQDDGWILRSDIIWSKPNPMPESVDDRPTRAHEYIFMLVKSSRYFYDAEAIREQGKEWNGQAGTFNRSNGKATRLEVPGQTHSSHRERDDRVAPGRNKRSVWEIATQPYPQAHYATFPTKLVEPMILASTSHRGVCPECGKGWVRVIEKSVSLESGSGKAGNKPNGKWANTAQAESGDYDIRMGPVVTSKTTGWRPACNCENNTPIPAVILDPFCGSGTVGEVSRNLGRRFIGLDLSAQYLAENALPRAENKTSQKSLESFEMFQGALL